MLLFIVGIILTMSYFFNISIGLKNISMNIKREMELRKAEQEKFPPLPEDHIKADEYFEIAKEYRWGLNGVEKNLDKALELFKKAAELDRPWAHYHVASIYYDLERESGDMTFTNTIKWSNLAIENVQYRGYAMLASVEKVRGNEEKQMEYVRLGVENNDAYSMKMLGDYHRKLGGELNLYEAFKYYRMAWEKCERQAREAAYDMIEEEDMGISYMIDDAHCNF